LKQID